jgi:hypothetical protein
MMGGVSSETCSASYKYRIIKFWCISASCWIFLKNCTMMHGSTNIKCMDVVHKCTDFQVSYNGCCTGLLLWFHDWYNFIF